MNIDLMQVIRDFMNTRKAVAIWAASTRRTTGYVLVVMPKSVKQSEVTEDQLLEFYRDFLKNNLFRYDGVLIYRRGVTPNITYNVAGIQYYAGQAEAVAAAKSLGVSYYIDIATASVVQINDFLPEFGNV